MKKNFIIFFLSLNLGLLLVPFIAYANKTAMNTYYPSPSGNYTKFQLANASGGPNESSATSPCLQTSTSPTYDSTPTPGHTYINAGTIFTDPTSGFLEICKSDGTVASYPGASINRFCTTGASGCPSASSVGSACPSASNYVVTSVSSTSLFSGVTSYSCGLINSEVSGGPTTSAKSGCFSIYANGGVSGTTLPAACNSSSGDPNAYDMGCDTIYSVDMNATGPIYKRNCCFNATGIGNLTTASTCTPPTVNGACGTSYNNCTSGQPTGGNGGDGVTTAWIWSCNGSGGGTNISCGPMCEAPGYSVSGPTTCVPNITGVCNSTYNTCTAGTPETPNGGDGITTSQTWACVGSGTGTNASCGPICSAGYTVSGGSCICNGPCSAPSCLNGTCAAPTTCGGAGVPGVCGAVCSGGTPCGTYPACTALNSCGSCTVVNLGCGCGAPAPNACGSCTGVVDLGCGCGAPAPNACGSCTGVVNLGCGCGLPGPDVCGVCGGNGSECAPVAGACNTAAGYWGCAAGTPALETGCSSSASAPSCGTFCGWTWECVGINGGATSGPCILPDGYTQDACGVCNGDGSTCGSGPS